MMYTLGMYFKLNPLIYTIGVCFISAKNDHAKITLVHKLHCEEFWNHEVRIYLLTYLLTYDQYSKCLKKGGKGTWYTLTLEVFTQYLC